MFVDSWCGTVSVMASLTDALDELRSLPSKAKQGLAFEKLMVNYFKTDPVLRSEYDEVYRWVDWPLNGEHQIRELIWWRGVEKMVAGPRCNVSFMPSPPHCRSSIWIRSLRLPAGPS